MYGGYLTDIEGIKVGHSEDEKAMTGCTVILCEKGTTGGVEVRGGGPATRETDTFVPERGVNEINGIVLTGGSTFGLDSSVGVMEYLEEQNIGIAVDYIHLPIVASAVIFDLLIGDHNVRPDKNMGYKAAKNATTTENRQGNIGCGIGATVGKLAGPEYTMKGGLGSATVQAGDLKVSALVVVNAVGDVYDYNNGNMIVGNYDKNLNKLVRGVDILKDIQSKNSLKNNTTIGVVATNAKLTKSQANKISEMAHNGYARTINPIHTYMDGDTIFTLATNKIESDIALVGSMASEAVSKAIMNAVKKAETLDGYIAYKDIQNI